LFAQPDIDGGLIGGASLKAADFFAIMPRQRLKPASRHFRIAGVDHANLV
jgi:hypothetical protein